MAFRSFQVSINCTVMPRIKQIMQFGTGEEALFEDEIGRSVARFFFLL